MNNIQYFSDLLMCIGAHIYIVFYFCKEDVETSAAVNYFLFYSYSSQINA
jgi:hypothetical protein